MRLWRQSSPPIGAHATCWNGIYDLRVVGQQRPKVVGAVAQPFGTPGFVQYADLPTNAEIAVIPDQVDGSTVRGDVRLIRQIRIDQDLKATMRVKKEADRRGDGTCLDVRRTDPLACIIKQLHIGHDYIKTPWRLGTDSPFIDGLLGLAEEHMSEIIVTGISNREHMRDAQDCNIRYAVFESSFLRRS